ncbi:unnamed protein product, partial [Parascedosporium putredinis]
KLPFS